MAQDMLLSLILEILILFNGVSLRLEMLPCSADNGGGKKKNPGNEFPGFVRSVM